MLTSSTHSTQRSPARGSLTARRVCAAGVTALLYAGSVTPWANATSPARVLSIGSISHSTLPATGAEAHTEAEPSVAIDPSHPAYVAAAFQQNRYADGAALAIGYAWSLDGGRTWRHNTLPKVTSATGGPFERVTDPAVAYGADGSVYVASIGGLPGVCGSTVVVSRSTDHGATFAKPVWVENDECPLFPDKDWIAVDTSHRSPHFGRIYVFFDQSQQDPPSYEFPTVMRWSDDHGRTWSPLVHVTTSATDTIGSQPVIESDGTIVDVLVHFTDQEKKSSIDAVISHDGGRSFAAPVRIATNSPYVEPDVRAGDMPSACVDPSTGRIYVVMERARRSGDGLNDIVLASSHDEGRTWSSLRRVNSDGRSSGIDHFTPEIAANGGELMVTFRTRDRKGTPSRFVKMAYEVSGDGGAHFGLVADLGPSSDLHFAAQAPVSFFGDYDGLAASNKGFVAVWNVSSPHQNETTHQTTWGAALAR